MKYEVLINGISAKLYEARVSAFPINRVWQGKQRTVDQTENAYFVSFDIASRASICVKVLDEDIEKAQIRPLSYGIPFDIKNGSIVFELEKPMQITVEINGYHRALHIFANPPYKYIPRENDIYFPPGVHRAGLIAPKSGQRVVVAEGAVVYGVVYIKDAENVSVEGRGIIDASPYRRGNDTFPDGQEVNSALRDLSLGLSERDVHYTGLFNVSCCKNVVIDGVILRDSQFWTLIIRNGCDDVRINNVKIIGQWRYNSDGIDICASDNVVVQNCFVRSFDDCIVVRAPHLDGESGGCRHITVENNVLWCEWGKNLEIWSGERDSEIRDIVFRNNFLIHVQMIAVSIDTWFGSENILVEDVLYDGVHVEHDDVHMHSHFQTSDEDRYDLSRQGDRSDMSLVRICVGRLGKNLGNQQFDTNVDTPSFKIRYRRISLNGVTQTGNFKAPIHISSEKLFELSDITINGIDYKEYLT